MQHNNWGKDRDFLAEAYMQTGGAVDDEAYSIEDNPEEAAEDGENKTGDMSDEELLEHFLKHARTADGKLKPAARDALALYAQEDGEHKEEEASNYM